VTSYIPDTCPKSNIRIQNRLVD